MAAVKFINKSRKSVKFIDSRGARKNYNLIIESKPDCNPRQYEPAKTLKNRKATKTNSFKVIGGNAKLEYDLIFEYTIDKYEFGLDGTDVGAASGHLRCREVQRANDPLHGMRDYLHQDVRDRQGRQFKPEAAFSAEPVIWTDCSDAEDGRARDHQRISGYGRSEPRDPEDQMVGSSTT
ncbi:hypothetical protein AB2B41_19720 [Marimonas sp. MJW-29]|uniref:Uncharacterized protein n=1 Tax=Sulfitobacter sediminis TaxID=3234186 RepID=A0ABV3RTL2_9RHOB